MSELHRSARLDQAKSTWFPFPSFKMKASRVLLLVLAAAVFVSSVEAVRHVQAIWRQELLITRLVGYEPHEFLVTSQIFGTKPREGFYYSIQKKVAEMAKTYHETTDSDSGVRRVRQVLAIALFETSDASEFRAEFTHEVFEDGELKLRFSGVTMVPRWQSNQSAEPGATDNPDDAQHLREDH